MPEPNGTLRFLINGGVIIVGGSENFRKFNKWGGLIKRGGRNVEKMSKSLKSTIPQRTSFKNPRIGNISQIQHENLYIYCKHQKYL